MSVLNFESLEYKSKIEFLYREGIYIGKRKLSRFTAILYQLEDFYVEVLFAKYRSEVKCFYISASTHILNPYLEQIDVKELMMVE